ncbi:MAG TPA: hypothetical protein PKC79_21500 [Solidesulfovibrio magneticus]|nr:hypothetical protein [Solidesulfovibrio magneticus]
MSGNPWTLTFTGVAFDLVEPTPDMVSIKDIAHALANQCRFAGHSRRYYSVAEHCLYVSRALPPALRLQGLLHDAAEAYVHDIVRPLKGMLPDYRPIELRVMKAVAARFDLPVHPTMEIHEADTRMLATEVEYLMPPASRAWVLPEPYELREIGLRYPGQMGLPPGEAHRRFLERFAELAA